MFDQTSPTISAAVRGIFQILPNPRFISCDHQTSFNAIKSFCDQYDIFCLKSTPSAKNELGSIDSACRITTQFIQKITTSLNQSLRLKWPDYVKILFKNINSRYSARNKFSRCEMFYGPFRFLPNHRMFSSDLFTVANQMLGETQLAADRRIQSSKRRSHFEELPDLSFPRNCIVKVILNKGDKATVDGSKKLLPGIIINSKGNRTIPNIYCILPVNLERI